MYRIVHPCVLLAVVTGMLFGQTKAVQTAKKPAPGRPAVTRIGKHRIGELFRDWLIIEKIDVASSGNQDLTQIQETGNGDAYTREGSGFTWTFHDGKLHSAFTGFEVEQWAQQLAFLKETYGPPSEFSHVTVQNGFGAKWTDPVAIWYMPDGTRISLRVQRDGDHLLVVAFQQRQPHAPPSNPYK
jgi:hypothetical protein